MAGPGGGRISGNRRGRISTNYKEIVCFWISHLIFNNSALHIFDHTAIQRYCLVWEMGWSGLAVIGRRAHPSHDIQTVTVPPWRAAVRELPDSWNVVNIHEQQSFQKNVWPQVFCSCYSWVFFWNAQMTVAIWWNSCLSFPLHFHSPVHGFGDRRVPWWTLMWKRDQWAMGSTALIFMQSHIKYQTNLDHSESYFSTKPWYLFSLLPLSCMKLIYFYWMILKTCWRALGTMRYVVAIHLVFAHLMKTPQIFK